MDPEIRCGVDWKADEQRAGFATGLDIALLAGFAVALMALLGPQWLHDPDLSHGLFAPAAALILIHESRRSGPHHYLAPGPRSTAALAVALGLGILALAVTGLYAAALDWSHALVGFSAGVAVSLLWLSGLLAFSRSEVRLVPLNWSSLVAAGLWILSAPVPPGTYQRLTLQLQLWVSAAVLNALHLLGVAAERHGNIIELARTSVGVEEACSGIRSLMSCIFAGVFFSGWLVRRPGSRFLVIAAAPLLAVTMNFVRSLVLTLLANSGVEIAGGWHDATGFAILAVTAALLAGFAVVLGRRDAAGGTAAAPPPAAGGRGRPPRLLTGGLVSASCLGLFFLLHAPLTPRVERPAPDLEAILPAHPSGWKVYTANDLNRFADTLKTDQFVQRTYVRDSAAGPVQITAYIAYWGPGQASASLVATHTPDACWPGAGWTPVATASTRADLAIASRPLAAAEFRRFVNRDVPQNVWFWHIYDRKPIHYLNPLSPGNLLQIALHFGFRRAGDQLFVRLSSNRPWDEIAGDPLLKDITDQLRPFGI